MKSCIAWLKRAVAVQIIGICRSVTFMCIGAIMFGATSQGSLDLALLPVIDSINHKSSSQSSSGHKCLFI